MNHTNILETIKAELDHVEPAALQSIWEIIGQAKRKPFAKPETSAGSAPTRADTVTAPSQPLKFVGENLTLEEYERLSPEERGSLQWRLKEQNHQWLQEKFAALNAAWLVVVDGKVTASGTSLEDKPRQPQILEICQRAGKFPFVFVNDKFIVIEESASAWHTTTRVGDYYPTLPVKLGAVSGVAGDFDTGF
jgi:hypothetical protein